MFYDGAVGQRALGVEFLWEGNVREANVAVIALALASAACGPDPRLSFIGTYEGPATTILKFSDGSSDEFPGGATRVVITAPEKSDELLFDGYCAFTATCSSDTAFTIKKKACPVKTIKLSNGVNCTLSETVNGGTGTRNDSTLTISYFGDSTLSACSDGSPNDKATYTTTLTVTRK